jgi:hypothetical protein
MNYLFVPVDDVNDCLIYIVVCDIADLKIIIIIIIYIKKI